MTCHFCKLEVDEHKEGGIIAKHLYYCSTDCFKHIKK